MRFNIHRQNITLYPEDITSKWVRCSFTRHWKVIQYEKFTGNNHINGIYST